MTDSLNQIGKIFKQESNLSDYALRRLHKKKLKIERANDVFDVQNSFRMEFFKNKNLNNIFLDLVFKPPVLTKCCAGDYCSRCEQFNAGEEFIQLDAGYQAGSVTMRINGRNFTNFTELSPPDGTVQINASITAGSIVRVCYVYASYATSGPIILPPSDGSSSTPPPSGTPSPSPIDSTPPPPTPPVIKPLPGLTRSGPVSFTHNGQIIENLYIDQAEGQTLTALQMANANGSASVYGKGFSGCILRNCTLRGRSWGTLLIDMDNLILEDVTILDCNYAAFGIFGGIIGRITRPIVRNVGAARPSNGLPSIGDAGNAYGVKFEIASQAGGSSTEPTGWRVENGIFDNIPQWQAINAHNGHDIIVTGNKITNTPRPIFFVGPLTNIQFIGNDCLAPIPAAGSFSSGDKSAITYGGINGLTINNNRMSSQFNNKLNNIGGNSNVTIGTNPIV